MPADWNADVTAVSLQTAMVGDVRTRLLLLLGAVALVLGIACANVANLLLSRGAARETEMAVRVAIGAGRRRIIRQMLTESVLLAAAGAAMGVGLAVAGLRVLKSALPADTPRLAEVSLDWRVLVFAAALGLVAAIAFGLAPAFHAARLTLTDSLKSGARGGYGVGRPAGAPGAGGWRGRAGSDAGCGVRHPDPEFLEPVARARRVPVRGRPHDAAQSGRHVLRQRQSLRRRPPDAADPDSARCRVWARQPSSTRCRSMAGWPSAQ